MRTISTLVFLAAFIALAAAEQSSGGKALRESTLSKIVPRLLWNLKRGDNQESHRNAPQPIIIVQQPSKSSDYDSDRHYHHRDHYPYYPYYQPPPPPPSRPPPMFQGMQYMDTPNGNGPTYMIINPNNMQGIYLPASSSNSSNSTSSRRSAFVPSIADLLQGLSLDDLSDGTLFEDDSDVVDAAEDGTVEVGNARPAMANDDRDEDLVSEEEIEALDRQSSRGVNPKHLVSILMQDKRRRRIQEVLAGIYMRNYNLNRK